MKEWLQQAEVARELGVSPPTIKRYREEGLIPKSLVRKIRKGRRVFVEIHKDAIAVLRKTILKGEVCHG